MAIMEVNLPSGFEFDADSLEDLKNKVTAVMRYDLEDGNTKADIYFNSIGRENTCVDLKATRVFKVAKPAQPYVQVYDYYDTTKKARAFYNPPDYDVCDICKSEEECAMENCV